jgi:DNA-directed RNA polymerase specialized sigma54-like protein
MSETATDIPTVTEIVTEPAATDDTLGDPGKRALDAERKARKAAEKAAADAAAKVKEYEDAQKSEAERLAAKVAELESRAAKAEAAALRASIVNETGIPADLADLVTGADEAAMRATAERLKSHLAPAQKFGPVDTGPKNVADSGLPKQLTRADLAGMSPAQIEAAQVAGQLADIMAGKTA